MRKITYALVWAAICSTLIHAAPGVGQSNLDRKVERQVMAASAVPISKSSSNDSTETASVTAAPMTSAPPLTRIFVNNVCTDSAGDNCETIGSGQYLTADTYSGSNVYVFVWEIGYGNGETATQGGATIASAYLIGKVGVCQSGSYYTINCPSGSTLVGWRYEWNAGYYLDLGYGEQFTAQDTSNVSPFNTLTTSIGIQYTR